MSGFELHLLRHGRPARTGLLLGHGDEPAAPGAHTPLLTRAASLSFDTLVTSDLSRAREGAEAIGRQRGVSWTIDRRWRELDFGAWDGLAPTQVNADALAQFWADPDAGAPPGGERWSDLCGRVSQALAPLERSTLVVTHAGAMRAALAVLTALDYRSAWAIDLPYGALLTLRVWPGEGPEAPSSAQITGLQT